MIGSKKKGNHLNSSNFSPQVLFFCKVWALVLFSCLKDNEMELERDRPTPVLCVLRDTYPRASANSDINSHDWC